ncbi:MAG TPA: retropepsin-like aspartic protease [Syntrophales bacterium]|nr:retropepsin-like aspartic protease [Syntrophales bacterium]
MLRLWCVTVGYALIILGCLIHPASESKAEEQVLLTRGIIAGVDSIAAATPRTEGSRLAQSGKKAEAQGGSETWKRMGETVISEGDEPTKVQIRGNSVFVPVTLANDGNEVDVYLLLDTGAAATLIHTEVAEKLYLDLGKAKKTRVQVVGGALISASVIGISRLTVGPHTKRNCNIVVVPHKGSGMRYDGLLGMDVLRGLKYRVDFKKQVINWE